MNLKESTICLIGGLGFLGSGFRKLYGTQFQKVVLLGRRSDPDFLFSNENYYNISNLSVEDISEILRNNNASIVVDFAYSTIPKTSFEHPIADFSENLLLVNKHLESVRAIRNCKYIYISSGGTVYGNTAQSPIVELNQNFPLSPYGITKMACERYVIMYHHLFEMDVIVLRPSNIYGPGQIPFRGQGFIATAMASACAGQRINVYGSGSHIRDYLFIDDFSDAVMDIIKYAPNGQIFNIGSGIGESINSIVSVIQDITSRSQKVLAIENHPERSFDVKYNVLDNSKLISLNNWQVRTPLPEGLLLTWDWIQNHMQQAAN